MGRDSLRIAPQASREKDLGTRPGDSRLPPQIGLGPTGPEWEVVL